MSYKKWLEAHCRKHQKIVEKLSSKGVGQNEILEYFEFENMLSNEPDFCLLYAENKKCHEIDRLNCYLCACPEFCFCDDGVRLDGDGVIYSYCTINSKYGKAKNFGGKIHQDCSDCPLPHTMGYIKKRFDKNISKIMQKCEVEPQK